MLRKLAIGSILFAGAFSVAQAADVYRWVDDHGGVHYSDQWVPGSEVIKSTKPHPVSTSESASSTPKSTSSSNTANALPKSAAVQAMQQDKAKVREQQCKEAKERYEKAIQARRIFKTKVGEKDTDGETQREYLSDEEADSYRVKARQDVQDLCGSAALKSE